MNSLRRKLFFQNEDEPLSPVRYSSYLLVILLLSLSWNLSFRQGYGKNIEHFQEHYVIKSDMIYGSVTDIEFFMTINKTILFSLY